MPAAFKLGPQTCSLPVFKKFVGEVFSLFPTAGVCNMHLSAVLRLLPTAGVCDQHLGIFLRLLPAIGVCDWREGVFLTLLASACWCTTKLSKLVPFFRAIGAKVMVAKRPLPGGRSPP